MKLSPITITTSGYHELGKLCPLNTFVTVNPGDLPISVPEEFLHKCVKAVVVGSGDSSNAVYMINFLRADTHPRYTQGIPIDQEPLMVAYYSGDSGVNLNAVFIHHGSWDGRTVNVGTGFRAAIQGSGIEQYYPYMGVPENDQGPISELKPDSHRHAFWVGVKAIKKDK